MLSLYQFISPTKGNYYHLYKPIGAAPRWHYFLGGKGAFGKKRVLRSAGYGFPRRKKSSASRQYCKSREEKIKLLSGVRCPVSVHPCVRNSYLSTSATNQDEYEDEIDDNNNKNDKDDNNKNVNNSYNEIDDNNNENDEDDNNKNVYDSYVNCRPVSVCV